MADDLVAEVDRRLAGLPSRAVADHVEVLAGVHALLQAALAQLDEG